MPGKLVNSNKIMVLLGENYFIGKKVLFIVKLMLIECKTVPILHSISESGSGCCPA